MDRNAILTAINQVIASGISRVEESNDPKQGHRFGPQLRSLASVEAPTEVIIPVRDALMSQPDLLWFIGIEGADPEVRSFGGEGFGIYPSKVAKWLLAKSIEPEGTPEKALASLESFMKVNAVEGVRVVAIWGLFIEEPVRIVKEIWLTPLSYLSPSLGRDHLDDALSGIGYHFPRAEDQLEHAVCAIAQGFNMEPAVYPADGDAPTWHKESSALFEELEELAYAIALISGAMPQVISRWLQTEKVDAIPGVTGGPVGKLEMPEIVPSRLAKLKPASAAEAAARIAAYARMPKSARQKMSVPLRRLSLARARRHIPDRAIETRIALESVFGAADSKVEISHKAAVRGALFTSVPKDRQRCYEILKAAYDLGSKAVHGSELEKYEKKICGEKRSGEEILAGADEYLRTALNKIVDSEQFPEGLDWINIELGL
jgi:hypothetical protein